MSGTERTGQGIAGSSFDGASGWFPEAGYDMSNFNGCDGCGGGCCCINDWGNHWMVRDCRLLTLIDLDLNNPTTHQNIVNYLNDLIDIGVAGFRVDAAKHMWPDHLRSVHQNLNNLNTKWFPSGSKAFLGLEVCFIGIKFFFHFFI